jgi:hypothetical protein
VVFALLMHRAHMPPQIARMPKRSVALRARVVYALLVHRAQMPAQIARLPKPSVALRARVVSLGPLAMFDLLHLLGSSLRPIARTLSLCFAYSCEHS